MLSILGNAESRKEFLLAGAGIEFDALCRENLRRVSYP